MYYFEWLFGLPWYFRVYEAGTLSSEESSVEVMTRPEDHQLVALKCFISSIFFRCFCIFGGIFAFIIEMFHFSLILLDFFLTFFGFLLLSESSVDVMTRRGDHHHNSGLVGGIEMFHFSLILLDFFLTFFGFLLLSESSVDVMTRRGDHHHNSGLVGGIEMFHFSLILLDFFQKKIWIFAFIRVLCGGNDTARGWSSQPWPSVQLVALEIFQVLKQPGNSPPHSILSVYLTVDSFLQVTCSTPKYSLITTRWKGIVSEAYCSTASGCGIWLVPFGAAVVEPMEYEHEEVCRLQLEKVS